MRREELIAMIYGMVIGWFAEIAWRDYLESRRREEEVRFTAIQRQLDHIQQEIHPQEPAK